MEKNSMKDNNKDIRILKYLRVSLDDEGDDESNSISYQRELLDGYIADNFSNANLIIDEIADDGYTGTNFRRPGITKVLNALSTGKYNCLIVKDFSRFGRDHIQVGNYLEHIFPEMGIRFISVNDNYDSKDLIGRTAGIDVVIKNLVYEMYSKDLSQKIRSAKEVMMKTGKYAPHSAFYGYIRDGKYGIRIDETAANIVKQIFQRADEGWKIADIAKELNEDDVPIPSVYKKINGMPGNWDRAFHNIWTNHTVRSILLDERYTGKMISGKYRRTRACDEKSVQVIPEEDRFVTENHHEPIISQELFDRVYSKIEHKKFSRRSKNRRACIFRCGGCGYVMQRSRSKEKRVVCCMRNSHISDECVDEWIAEAELNDVVTTVLKKQFEVMLDKAKLYKSLYSKEKIKSKKDTENEIAVLKRKRFDLYEQFKNGKITRELLDSKRAEIVDKIETLERGMEEVTTETSEQLNNSIDIILNYGEPEDFNEDFIKYFIKDVVVFKKRKIEIVWNFGLNELLKVEENV